MNKNKKIITIIGTLMVSLLLLTTMSFAIFTDSEIRHTLGIAGKVDIETQITRLTNFGNFNPGDGYGGTVSPSAGARSGTSHNLSMSTKNVGNKSVVTRNVITIIVNNGELDANMFLVHLPGGVTTEITNKYVSIDGNTFIKAEDAPIGTKIVAIRYISDQKVLSGTGPDAEIESQNIYNSVNNMYYIGMKREAGEEYELCNISVKIESQAMQYRNTADSDWETVFSKTLEN